MTAATVVRKSGALLAWQAAGLMLVAVVVPETLTETWVPTIIGRIEPLMDAGHLVIGIVMFAAALVFADRFWRLPWRRPSVAIALAFLGCLLAGWFGGVAWPNSGDEYSYVYLADTFLAGRLWNPVPPDPELFQSFHVAVNGGKMFSPYPVAWSAFLVPFRAVGAVWLANPVLTVLIGVGLLGACRRLNVSSAVQKPALALVLLTPFTLFLGGSVFPQTMACALVVGIVWAQLADDARPRPWCKLLIGALFGVLLMSRYDVFAIVALVYAIDRVVIKRLRVITDGLLVMAGWLPFVACQLAYNFWITGNPLQVVATWGAAGLFGDPMQGTNAILVLFSALKNLFWLGTMAQFGGLPILVLAVIALAMKIRRRTCRFYDFLLPMAFVFYSFVPFTGAHQYGPRYWFWAWPVSILTITSGLVDEAGYFRFRSRRVAFEPFVAACLVYAAGAFCVLLVTTHYYMVARRVVYAVPEPQTRSVVLLPTRLLTIWPWQDTPINAWSEDFVRNDIDFAGRVLFGRADAPDAVLRACRLDGREVYRWEAPGHLIRVVCP
jgi:hypothetical protein